MSTSGTAEMRSPLMNSLVLTRLFQFCTLSDLRKYRLVCKAWYAASEARIRNRNEMIVKITSDPMGPLNWSNFDSKFDVAGSPFRRFRVRGMEFQDPPSSSTTEEEERTCDMSTYALSVKTKTEVEKIYKNMEQFCEAHGQFMRKLELIDFSVSSVEAFKKAFFEQTPNLEELHLESVKPLGIVEEAEDNVENVIGRRIQSNLKSFSFLENEKPLPIGWKQIFLHFHKIEKLVVPNIGRHANSITSFHKVSESLNEVLLNELVLGGLYREHADELMKLFQLPKLKLSKLCISVDGTAEEERGIPQAALRNHGSTLKELDLTSYCCEADSTNPFFSLKYDDSEPDNNFPFQRDPLEQLTLLKLKGSVFQTFRFLEQTPNLKVLHVDTIDPSAVDYEAMNDDLKIIMNTSTRLSFLAEFECRGFCLTERQIEVFVNVMPNVENFGGDFDAAALPVICKNWRKLRALKFGFDVNDVDDEVLTGIEIGSGDDRLPNITDLKDLQELKIWNGEYIGDSSIWNAFLKMPQLSSVTVELSEETSPEAIDALLDQFPLADVSFA